MTIPGITVAEYLLSRLKEIGVDHLPAGCVPFPTPSSARPGVNSE